MSKLIAVAFTAVLLFPSGNLAREQFAKYKAIEAYEIRPGILIMPSYSADGQVCEIGLEKLHYSPEIIRLDSSLSRKEIDQIFDELVPVEERGSRSKNFAGDLITEASQGRTTNVVFENITIQIYDHILPASRKGELTVDEVAATLKWNNRKCQ